MSTIDAAVLREPREMAIEEVSLDEPRSNEVLVENRATGVCHTDLHRYNGTAGAPLPIVLGHEGAGIVESVGDGVTAVEPGDHVVMSVTVSCGRCAYCERGEPYICQTGARAAFGGTALDGTRRLHSHGEEINHFFCQSSFATKSVVPERCAVKIPEELPFEYAALLGCGATTGIGSILNTADVSAGESVAVFGAGGVGASAIITAELVGANPIIAVDIVDDKLDWAADLGATHTINSTRVDPVEEIVSITGSGVDYAFEFIGNPEVMAQAFYAIRPGGRAVITGRAKDDTTFEIDAPEIITGKQIIGNVVGSLRPHLDIPRYAEMHLNGAIDLGVLLTRTYRLDQLEQAFEDMEQGALIRSAISFD